MLKWGQENLDYRALHFRWNPWRAKISIHSLIWNISVMIIRKKKTFSKFWAQVFIRKSNSMVPSSLTREGVDLLPLASEYRPVTEKWTSSWEEGGGILDVLLLLLFDRNFKVLYKIIVTLNQPWHKRETTTLMLFFVCEIW